MHGRFAPRFWLIAGLLLSSNATAGGGVVLSEDTCIITIGFYTAHFTAYQPKSSGNKQYCEDLPEPGETIFVLEYLHPSMHEVPIDFRIIRNESGLGKYVDAEDVVALGDLMALSVFYQPPETYVDGTFSIDHTFAEKGDYIGVVTAGHPTSDALYTAVFPFAVGVRSVPYWLPIPIIVLLAALAYFLRRRAGSLRQRAHR